MIECTRVVVEGKTEELLLMSVYNLTPYPRYINSLGGKENVIKNFKDSIRSSAEMEVISSLESKEWNICYLVDGNDEGFEGIYNRLKGEMIEVELKAEKPYIKVCGDKGCHILVVIGKKDNEYRGCLETLLNEVLNTRVTSEMDEIVDRILNFMRKRNKLSACDEEKIKFFERVLLLSNEPSVLYINKNFVDELLKLVDPQSLKQILNIEIRPHTDF